jgi:hypothetical protein
MHIQGVQNAKQSPRRLLAGMIKYDLIVDLV